MVDEIAQMLIEDCRKKGLSVKPWERIGEPGKTFWRAQARAFIASVEG